VHVGKTFAYEAGESQKLKQRRRVWSTFQRPMCRQRSLDAVSMGTTSCRRWFTTMNSTDEEGYLGISYDFDVVVICTLLWGRSRR